MKGIVIKFNLLLLVVICALGACTKGTNVTYDLPVLVTNDVIIDATATNAWTGGIITNATGNFLAYGVCYSSSNPEPTLADSKTAEKIKLLSFNSNIKGLAPNTTYYVRAYATNSTGTGYGNVIQFKTGSAVSGGYKQVSTFSDGANLGLGITAFNHPSGVVTDANGNVYVSDSYNSVIKKITPQGIVSILAGSGDLGYKDGPAASAQFYAPAGLAIDATGNIYVADMGNNIIRKITPGGVVSTFAGSGNAGYSNGTGAAANFNSPTGIALGSQGNLYIADSGNNLIRMVTPAGVVSTVAGSRTAAYINGIGTAASFNKPTGIAADGAGNIYVTEPLNNAIRKINTDNLVTTFAGGLDSIALVMGKPQAITVKNGVFYIADAGGRVLKIGADKVLTVVAGKTGSAGLADGDGSSALFNYPVDITTDNQGNIYVADVNNNRIRLIK